jgi:hypothetical protein
MKPLPLPVRVAAGLAVTAVDRARHLPEKLAGLPVTMVSQALQLSMRLQQQMTELAIKGDDALSTLRPVEESPEWATFDEDSTVGEYDVSSAPTTERNGGRSRFETTDVDADLDPDPLDSDPLDDPEEDSDESARDPWADEEQAMRHELDNVGDDPVDSPETDPAPIEEVGSAQVTGPAALPGYADLTLPQVRARMRRLGADELAELADYERSHADRPEFVGMLTRRIGTLRDQR